MSLLLSEIKTKMQPYVLRHIDKNTAEWIFDTEFVDIVNYVQNQLNELGYLNAERYYRKTVNGTNNYEMAGDIIKIRRFKYEDSTYESQYYAVVQSVYGSGETHEGQFYSVIVLKNTPATSETQMDIHYLRRCFDLTVDSDPLDLPDKYIPEFLELLKIKIRVDFGNEDPALFEKYLDYYANKCRAKSNRPDINEGRVVRYWGRLDATSDLLYDITEKRLSEDHVISGESGYSWYE